MRPGTCDQPTRACHALATRPNTRRGAHQRHHAVPRTAGSAPGDPGCKAGEAARDGTQGGPSLALFPVPSALPPSTGWGAWLRGKAGTGSATGRACAHTQQATGPGRVRLRAARGRRPRGLAPAHSRRAAFSSSVPLAASSYLGLAAWSLSSYERLSSRSTGESRTHNGKRKCTADLDHEQHRRERIRHARTWLPARRPIPLPVCARLPPELGFRRRYAMFVMCRVVARASR